MHRYSVLILACQLLARLIHCDGAQSLKQRDVPLAPESRAVHNTLGVNLQQPAPYETYSSTATPSSSPARSDDVNVPVETIIGASAGAAAGVLVISIALVIICRQRRYALSSAVGAAATSVTRGMRNTTDDKVRLLGRDDGGREDYEYNFRSSGW